MHLRLQRSSLQRHLARSIGIDPRRRAREHPCAGGSDGRGRGGRGGGGSRAVAAGQGDAGDARGRAIWGSGELWAQYLEFLDSSPILSRALTRGLVAGLGNLVCQLCVERGELDLWRLAMYASMGFVLIGPTLYFWYGLLARLVPGTGFGSVLASVALDQLAFQPGWIVVLMTYVAAFEGRLATVSQKLKQDWADAMRVSLMIWIPAQLVNFRFVPLALRVTYDTAVAVLWHVYLSFQSHKAVRPATA